MAGIGRLCCSGVTLFSIIKGAEGAIRATSFSCSKSSCSAVINRGTTVFARHDLGVALCGCLAGQVGASFGPN